MLRTSLARLTIAALGLAAWTTLRAESAPASPTLPPMPEAVTSFGAATAGEWLYVFGGHKGHRHDYSAEKVSGTFHRLRLPGGGEWETLPSAAPGQGQPLVAHEGRVYRIGGMAARNPNGEKQDLYSLALAQRFDPATQKWEDLPALPEPRSSHDAVVLGGKLYVAGGWQMMGGTNNNVWPKNGLVLDLAQPQSVWQSFPQPFQRRALALATVGSRVYCIGGMDKNNAPTLAVEVYDTATGQWSKGPELPNGKNKGFSCSAIAQAGRIYANAFQGDLLRLSEDGKAWEIVGRLEHPRLAHRLVTAGSTQLIALGGEDAEGKQPSLELLTPAIKPLPPVQSAAATPNTQNQ